MRTGFTVLLTLSLLTTGCGGCESPADTCGTDRARAGASVTCATPGWDDRAYDAYLPDDYEPGSPAPLLLALHGGGGSRAGAISITCPEGDTSDPDCLHRMANERGYVVVAPDGTGAKLLGNVRTWNAGGGEDDWQCVSGVACKNDVDDVAFFRDLLDDLDGWLSIDRDRVYATGLSNGAAMSHRLACDLSGEIAAVVAVSGTNQVETSQGCEPAEPVAVMEIHGTDDPCWPYDGGEAACLQKDGGEKNPVEKAMANWADRNGCDAEPATEPVPDAADDGTTTERVAYQNCDAPVVLMRVEGAGHTWPDGDQYVRERRIGTVNRDFGSEVILDFLD